MSVQEQWAAEMGRFDMPLKAALALDPLDPQSECNVLGILPSLPSWATKARRQASTSTGKDALTLSFSVEAQVVEAKADEDNDGTSDDGEEVVATRALRTPLPSPLESADDAAQVQSEVDEGRLPPEFRQYYRRCRWLHQKRKDDDFMGLSPSERVKFELGVVQRQRSSFSRQRRPRDDAGSTSNDDNARNE